ncbi:hypothetical protein GCM10010313_02530 [Streptomyces violarus]|nr:hypothetical protein GCM10010313_02530 [Streptomyces violarus]
MAQPTHDPDNGPHEQGPPTIRIGAGPARCTGMRNQAARKPPRQRCRVGRVRGVGLSVWCET